MPFPKNPAISKVFREIGLADELGSGMRNTYKYTQLYSGESPIFEEGNIFRTIIPLKKIATQKVGGEDVTIDVTMDVTKDVTMEEAILRLIRESKEITTTEMAVYLSVTRRTIQRCLDILKDKGIVERKGGKRYGSWEIRE